MPCLRDISKTVEHFAFISDRSIPHTTQKVEDLEYQVLVLAVMDVLSDKIRDRELCESEEELQRRMLEWQELREAGIMDELSKDRGSGV